MIVFIDFLKVFFGYLLIKLQIKERNILQSEFTVAGVSSLNKNFLEIYFTSTDTEIIIKMSARLLEVCQIVQ